MTGCPGSHIAFAFCRLYLIEDVIDQPIVVKLIIKVTVQVSV
jgi:hypothetical protein